MKNICEEKKYCRFCGGNNIKIALDLGSSPLCDEYRSENNEQKYFPLALKGCHDCGGVQTSHVINSEEIYEDYIYFTSTSPGLDLHYSKYASDTEAENKLNSKLFVVDVGSNDGCLLEKFAKYGHQVLGVEPSKMACEAAKKLRGVDSINEYFDDSVARKIAKGGVLADIITFNNVFANIDDLDGVLKAIDILLAENGLVIVESSYLFDMIDNMVFDFVYHEHLSYLSISSMQNLFEKKGFIIVDCLKVNTKGGSMRYIIARKNSSHQVSERLASYKLIESSRKNIFTELEEFYRSINSSKNEFIALINRYASRGRLIGYGASATTTTLLHSWGIGQLFNFLVDDNPKKIGTHSPGYQLPVLSLDQANIQNNDVVVLLAWRFTDLILNRLRNFNGVTIIPLPYPQILSK